MSSSKAVDKNLDYQDLFSEPRRFNTSNKEFIFKFEKMANDFMLQSLTEFNKRHGKEYAAQVTLISDLPGYGRASVSDANTFDKLVNFLTEQVGAYSVLPAMKETGLKYGPVARYFVPDSFMLQLKKEEKSLIEEADSKNEIFGLQIVRKYDASPGYYAVALPDEYKKTPGGLFAALKEYKEKAGVEFAEPDEVAFDCLLAPVDATDYYYCNNYQWCLKDNNWDDEIYARDAWGVTTGVANVVIAVLDTGLYRAHNEFTNKVVDRYNAIGGAPDTTDVTDSNGHGTWVTGIAAAATNNGTCLQAAGGIASVGWNCKTMPVKICSDTSIVVSNAVNGVNYVKTKIDANNSNAGSRYIVNMSWSVSGADISQLHGAISTAFSNANNSPGAVFVAASGDGNVDIGQGATAVYPAAWTTEVIPVGSHRRNRTGDNNNNRYKSDTSNYGNSAVMAPGVGIHTTGTNSTTHILTRDGSSMASAIVSGVAALVWSRSYQSNGNQFSAAFVNGNVRNRILANGLVNDVIGGANAGRIHAYNAVNF